MKALTDAMEVADLQALAHIAHEKSMGVLDTTDLIGDILQALDTL